MQNSGHVVSVVKVPELHKIEGSDFLSLIWIDGFSVVVNTAEWKNRELGAYIPPDNLVDTKRPEFEWLKDKADSNGYYRVKAAKIRKTASFGLMVLVDENKYKEGDDVTADLGVLHYDPVQIKAQNRKEKSGVTAIENVKGPNLIIPKYDLENFRKHSRHTFDEEQVVIVHEKIEGQNCRYVYSDGKMYCGSRSNWKSEFPPYKQITLESLVEKLQDVEEAQKIYDYIQTKKDKKDLWWQLLEKTPQIEAFCKQNPDYVLFGEMYGYVKGFPYDCKQGEIKFAAFDIMYNGKFLDWDNYSKFIKMYDIPTVPLYGEFKYNFDMICEMAEGKSVMNKKHIKEGVVVRPLYENAKLNEKGRPVLKCVGLGYLDKKKGNAEMVVDE